MRERYTLRADEGRKGQPTDPRDEEVRKLRQAQTDWAHFGQVQVGRAKRTLSCFVMTLSYSRALYLEFSSIRPWRVF